MRYTLKNAVLLGLTLVLNVVIATIIWYFGQESSARVDLSSDSTFIAVAMAVVFVGAVWVWYTLPAIPSTKNDHLRLRKWRQLDLVTWPSPPDGEKNSN